LINSVYIAARLWTHYSTGEHIWQAERKKVRYFRLQRKKRANGAFSAKGPAEEKKMFHVKHFPPEEAAA